MDTIIIDASSLTDAGLSSIAEHHRRLRTLRLSQRTKITNAGLADLLSREPILGSLSLEFCDSLIEECLRSIGILVLD